MKPYYKIYPNEFIKAKLGYYCDECDYFIVDSTKPETGGYFLLFGTQWLGGDKLPSEGKYGMFILAACRSCLADI